MEKRWSSWSEMEEQYREGALALKTTRERLKDEDYYGTIADREIMGSMIRDLEDTARILKRKVLYEFGSLSENELALLTDRQREIAELRQRYNYREIAERTGLDAREVFVIFKQAVNKVKKLKRQQQEGIPVGLSPQQEQIYKMFFIEGKTKTDIGKTLSLSINSVKKQIQRIKNKMGVTKPYVH